MATATATASSRRYASPYSCDKLRLESAAAEKNKRLVILLTEAQFNQCGLTQSNSGWTVHLKSVRSVGLSVCRSVGLSVCRSVGLSVDRLTEPDMAQAWYRPCFCQALPDLCRTLSVDNCRATCRSVELLSDFCRDSLDRSVEPGPSRRHRDRAYLNGGINPCHHQLDGSYLPIPEITELAALIWSIAVHILVRSGPALPTIGRQRRSKPRKGA